MGRSNSLLLIGLGVVLGLMACFLGWTALTQQIPERGLFGILAVLLLVASIVLNYIGVSNYRHVNTTAPEQGSHRTYTAGLMEQGEYHGVNYEVHFRP